jgi:hypothetical protein
MVRCALAPVVSGKASSTIFPYVFTLQTASFVGLRISHKTRKKGDLYSIKSYFVVLKPAQQIILPDT